MYLAASHRRTAEEEKDERSVFHSVSIPDTTRQKKRPQRNTIENKTQLNCSKSEGKCQEKVITQNKRLILFVTYTLQPSFLADSSLLESWGQGRYLTSRRFIKHNTQKTTESSYFFYERVECEAGRKLCATLITAKSQIWQQQKKKGTLCAGLGHNGSFQMIF